MGPPMGTAGSLPLTGAAITPIPRPTGLPVFVLQSESGADSVAGILPVLPARCRGRFGIIKTHLLPPPGSLWPTINPPESSCRARK